MVINTRALMKPLGYQTSFVPVNRTIRKIFSPKNPLATNYVLGLCRWNKFPSPIPNKSIKLFTHGMTPFRIFDGTRNRGGFKRCGSKMGGEVKFLNGFVDVILGSGNNGAGGRSVQMFNRR